MCDCCEDEDCDEEEDETQECPYCNEECGYVERGYCIEDECGLCGEWLENCQCECDD